jgi:hypothetical protein
MTPCSSTTPYNQNWRKALNSWVQSILKKVTGSANTDRWERLNATLDQQTRITHDLLKEISDRQMLTNLALGRLIAKIDPNYAKDSHSRETKDESDKIGREVINRLYGEYKASTAWNPPR